MAVCAHTHTLVRTHACIHTHTNEHTRAFVHTHSHIHTHEHIRAYTCVYRLETVQVKPVRTALYARISNYIVTCGGIGDHGTVCVLVYPQTISLRI